MLKDREPSTSYDFSDSVADALSPMNILKRIFLFIVFGIVLALKTLVSNIDVVGRTGGGFWAYLTAISSAMWQGVWLSLGSMWSVIVQPQLYFSTHSYGSIGFAIFSMAMLMLFFFQPISLLINIIDGQKGNATGTLLRLFVTFIVVMVLSCIIFYTGAGDTITSSLPAINDTVINVTTNVTQNITGGSIVNLL